MMSVMGIIRENFWAEMSLKGPIGKGWTRRVFESRPGHTYPSLRIKTHILYLGVENFFFYPYGGDVIF